MPAPKERDLEKTRKDVERWLSGKLREATEVRVGALSGPGNTGFSSDTILFDATWKEAGTEVERPLVARIEPRGFNVFPVYDVAKQFRIQKILAETKVPSAPMYWLEHDESFLGAPFYVMGRVDGRIPTDNPPYHVGGWVTEISPEERQSIWWSGLDALAEIHALDWRGLGLDFLDRPGASALDAHLQEYESMWAWIDGRPNPNLETALCWLRDNRPSEDAPTVISWGDARMGNMIFDGGRCVAVLDWEMAALGSPELDLAWWLFLDRHHSEGVEAPRLPGFPSHEASIARYAEQTGHTPKHLDYYEVFAALRFSVIMARLAQQMVHYGVLPADSNFEVDNTCSRMLAKLLELPAPGHA